MIIDGDNRMLIDNIANMVIALQFRHPVAACGVNLTLEWKTLLRRAYRPWGRDAIKGLC